MTAFSATYADWKLVKTRACVQVVFEIPVEQSDAAYQLLGGMPVAAREVWCGIARLDSQQRGATLSHVEATPRPVQPTLPASAGDDKPRKSPAQIAGYLCKLPAFSKFLGEKFRGQWDDACERVHPEEPEYEVAAECVRAMCNVKSRAELTDKNTEWHALQLAFRLWENHPELEDA